MSPPRGRPLTWQAATNDARGWRVRLYMLLYYRLKKKSLSITSHKIDHTTLVQAVIFHSYLHFPQSVCLSHRTDTMFFCFFLTCIVVISVYHFSKGAIHKTKWREWGVDVVIVKKLMIDFVSSFMYDFLWLSMHYPTTFLTKLLLDASKKGETKIEWKFRDLRQSVFDPRYATIIICIHTLPRIHFSVLHLWFSVCKKMNMCWSIWIHPHAVMIMIWIKKIQSNQNK